MKPFSIRFMIYGFMQRYESGRLKWIKSNTPNYLIIEGKDICLRSIFNEKVGKILLASFLKIRLSEYPRLFDLFL